MLALLLASLLFQDPQDAGSAPPSPPAPTAPRSPRSSAAPRVPAVPPVPPVPPAYGVENDPRGLPGDVLRGDWGKPSGKRVSLDDTSSIDDTLQEIADAASWNVSINTGRTGHKLLVLKFKDVPVEDALRAALRGTGLVATKSGNIVVVAPPDVPLPDIEGPAPILKGFDKPSGKKFTGDFSGVKVDDALRQIAKAGSLSIVIPPEAGGAVHGSFQGAAVEDALAAVLAQAGLRAELQGSVIMVKEQNAFDVQVNVPSGTRREIREAMREAREAARDAAREARDAAREAIQDVEDEAGSGRDRHATGESLSIAPGDRVRDVNVIRGHLDLQHGAVARDVSVVQGNALLQGGAVARDVVSVLGNVKLDGGATARQVVAVGGDVEVAAGATVENDVISIGGRVRVDPEADVGGSRRSITLPGLPSVIGVLGGQLSGRHATPLWAIVQILVKFVVLFVLGLLVLSLFPRRLDSVTSAMMGHPGKSVLIGLLGTLLLPVLTVLLVVTLVGIPLVAVQVLAVIAAGVLGVTALVFLVGKNLPLPTQQGPAVAQLAVGVGIFAILTEVPFLGVIVWTAVWLLTFGAVLRSRFGQPGQPGPGSPLDTSIPPPAAA